MEKEKRVEKFIFLSFRAEIYNAIKFTQHQMHRETKKEENEKYLTTR